MINRQVELNQSKEENSDQKEFSASLKVQDKSTAQKSLKKVFSQKQIRLGSSSKDLKDSCHNFLERKPTVSVITTDQAKKVVNKRKWTKSDMRKIYQRLKNKEN